MRRPAARRSLARRLCLAVRALGHLAVERSAREPLSLTIASRLRASHAQLHVPGTLAVQLELQLDSSRQHHVVLHHLVHHVRAALHAVQQSVVGAEATIQNVQAICKLNVIVK